MSSSSIASEIQTKSHPLQRDHNAGINPVTLSTGYFGSRGERIRHVVHEGALRLPREALECMDIGTESPTTSSHFELPALDSVQRPTMRGESFIITTVRALCTPNGTVLSHEDGTIQTIAYNVSYPSGSTPDRLRGGGDEDQPPTGDQANSGNASNVNSMGYLSSVSPIPQPQPLTLPSEIVGPPAVLSSTNPPTSPLRMPMAPPPTPTSMPVSSMPVSSMPPPVMSSAANQPVVDLSTASDSGIANSTTLGSMRGMNEPPISTNAASVSNPTPVTSISMPKPVSGSGASEDPTRPSSEGNPTGIVQPLPGNRPPPQWEQQMMGTGDEMPMDPASRTPRPAWYSPDQVSDIERTLLPEWFNGSAAHRNEIRYIQTREAILALSEKLGPRYVTNAMVRRSIPGDAASLMRLHEFLNAYSMINEDAMNDSQPMALPDEKLHGQKRPWNALQKQLLVETILDQHRKRSKVDWDHVANVCGRTPAECESGFLGLALGSEPPNDHTLSSATTDSISTPAAGEEKILSRLIESTPSHLVQASIQAVLSVSESTIDAPEHIPEASLVGVIASHANELAQSRERDLSSLLGHMLDVRMQKLENRLSILDDVEGLLEAERIALNLERRDLYTARCRYWFQGA